MESDDLEAQFVRSIRRRRAIFAVVFASLIASPFAYVWWQRHKVVVKNEAWEAEQAERERAEEAFRNRPLSADEARELRQLAPSTKQALLDMRDAWRRNVTPDALAAVVPTESRCPESFSAPTIGAGESYVKYGSIDGNYFGSMHYDVVRTGEPIPEPAFARMLAEVEAISDRIAGGRLLRPDLAALDKLGRGDTELFVLADERADAIVTGDSYIAGKVAGTAYLYSHAQRRVICAADIDVKNAPEVEIRYTHRAGAVGDEEIQKYAAAKAVLERDMDVQLRRAIATSMRATEERP
jgi:hypothetical protein